MLPDDNHPLLFVYGTLKRDFGNHRVMAEAGGEFICEAETAMPFPLVERGLPFLLDCPGEGYCVRGELYRIGTRAGWQRLDNLEGHPTFYRRRVIEIEADDDTLEVWTYFLVCADKGLVRLPHLRAYERNSGLRIRQARFDCPAHRTTRFASPPVLQF